MRTKRQAENRMRQKHILIPSIITVVGIMILLALGTWQVFRLEEKTRLLTQIDERTNGQPLPLVDVLAAHGGQQDIEYQRVQLKGRFDHGKEAYLQTSERGQFGWRVIVPFLTEQGVIFLDRGFVPPEKKDATKRKSGLLGETVTIIGLARKFARPNAFVPDNDLAKNVWYWPDLKALATWSGYSKAETGFYIQDQNPAPGGWPRGGATLLKIPNNHLSYSMTWYGLAIVLSITYLVWLRAEKNKNRKTRAEGE